MVAGLLGVLKAGGAYVPIDPEYPEDRVALILADCAASVVISQERLLGRLPGSDAVVVCIDRDWPAIRGEPSENLGPTAAPLNLAYVIYTSGSTGRPKGVGIPHSGACNFARALRAVRDPSGRSRSAVRGAGLRRVRVGAGHGTSQRGGPLCPVGGEA